MSSPSFDPPFDPDQVHHIAGRLYALGITLDRDWLVVDDPNAAMLFKESHGAMLARARQCVPQSPAQWELSEFFQYSIPGAAFDCQWISSYRAFEFLYIRILGEKSRPWLPSLYLAAATLPSLAEEARRDAVITFDTDVFGDTD